MIGSYPRVRGEQSAVVGRISAADGSSPRARGTVPRRHNSDAAPRFIPACAGNRVRPSQVVTVSSVHPRVRGEQKNGEITHQIPCRAKYRSMASRFIPACAGNSDRQAVAARQIPACAGNSREGHVCIRQAAVHPRVRGEQQSPRARGTDH
eukprot:TRINITY_DN1790_c0_g1_i9.p1 TRINITY_DN1790_c0_g1~~TRINITY_DN1790_c0_g1_i9.p1  ORF type:complete len:151 (-),score=10.10 TRINITY_DN1790_c0_g1_i9:189-641(-)